ncbi:MAG: S8 family peptidase [Clostridiales bacterium]|nr:S8 family peptidase [Clostridiales bacterium]
MTEEERQCREEILSENYLDFIYSLRLNTNEILQNYGSFCSEPISFNYRCIHLDRNRVPNYNVADYRYESIPLLYSLLDTSAISAAGISPLHIQPDPNLRGQQVILGFIDTGIDYRNTAFRKSDGSTRIIALWDQTIQSDQIPSVAPYGTEYREEDINEALRSSDPYSVVPSRDENGHGTLLAGIAAGSESSDGSFSGAAPEALLAVVKCKPAKQNLRDYYFANGPDLYQSTDILLAIQFLLTETIRRNLPLVLCIGMGTNSGAHDGTNILEKVLDRLSSSPGFIPVMAAGNEGNRQHHYFGRFTAEETTREVLLQIPEDTPGFRLELWGSPSDTYSLGFLSPSGELAPRIPAALGQSQQISFPLNATKIRVDYTLTAALSGNLLISVGFQTPSPGIWTIRVFRRSDTAETFHIWLPAYGQINPDPIFLRPDPDVTITSPGNGLQGVTVSTWNHRADSLYLYSSRGYTRDNRIRPDLAAPGVQVSGPGPGGSMTTGTGSSIAAAITAGAAACLLTWGITNRNDPAMDAASVRSYLIRGARRKNVYIYPNREWGYGTLDLAGVFENLQIP